MKIENSLIYEDNHLLVINKPAGLLTQDSGRNEENLEAWAKEWLKEKYQKSGNVFLGAIHRLDRQASGIVLFARTSKALSRLQKAMRLMQLRKQYISLIEGVPQALEGSLEHFIFHDDHRARIVSESFPGAKKARLRYRVLEKSSRGAMVEIELETGRYHQIRAQLAEIGHPIWGDVKYGSRIPWAPGIALHHAELRVVHPITAVLHTFTAPPCFVTGLE